MSLSLQTFGLESLLLGLDRRLPELEQDVAMLEQEDDGKLYGALSLHVIENELTEIQQLIDKLNSSTSEHKFLSDSTAQKVLSIIFFFTIITTFNLTIRMTQNLQFFWIKHIGIL